jgi:catechol 2,3-dioxygenase-like lactoylglutathione lyase family enzyme
MDAQGFLFAFRARDFERAVSFYRDILGLPQIEGWDRPDGKGAQFAVDDTSIVEIFGVADGMMYDGPSPSTGIHIAIRMANRAALDAMYEDLVRKNIDVFDPPQDRAWGHRTFAVRDPDGIEVAWYCEV